jgi:hypothetical protein
LGRSFAILLPFPAVSHKMPATLGPEWKRATIKYRAAQAQDPISNP